MNLDSHGSHIEKGKLYSVLHCRGPVRYRQQLASNYRVACYAEAHLNSVPNPKVQHAFVITGKHTPPNLLPWATAFLAQVKERFGIQSRGVVRDVPGSGCVQWVQWPIPSMLLEPAFISDPEMARILSTGEGLDAMGKCLAESIRLTFPAGGLVGLSVGHMHRGTGDTGAPLPAGEWDWDEFFDSEGELCDAYVTAAAEMLVAYERKL